MSFAGETYAVRSFDGSVPAAGTTSTMLPPVGSRRQRQQLQRAEDGPLRPALCCRPERRVILRPEVVLGGVDVPLHGSAVAERRGPDVEPRLLECRTFVADIGVPSGQ